jgi:hypothetical protein
MHTEPLSALHFGGSMLWKRLRGICKISGTRWPDSTDGINQGIIPSACFNTVNQEATSHHDAECRNENNKEYIRVHIFHLKPKHMKKALAAAAVIVAIASCNSKTETAQQAGSTVARPPIVLSLPATYSSSFEMGKPEYAATIVQGSWKDWQDNKMNNMKTWMADSVVIYQSDNKMVKGIDSVQARWNRGRANYTNVVDSIDAVMSVTSTDKKEDWVLVWATEYSTDTKGVKDTVAVMETWRMNNEGKADLLFQFDRHSRKK